MVSTTSHLESERLKKLPLLTADEEVQLANEWQNDECPKAIKKLIEAHQKLVNKIAAGYRGYGLSFHDLVAEGNIGMMQALKNFDSKKGFRFSTYAMWWIRAQMQEFIIKSASMVKMGTTAAQRKLFFGLKKAKEKSGVKAGQTLTPTMIKKIAKDLKVNVKEVKIMEKRLQGRDGSLNQSVGGEDGAQLEWQDWISDKRDTPEESALKSDELIKRRNLLLNAMKSLKSREIEILSARRLDETPKTLEELSQKLGISRERVRQIENGALEKVRKEIMRQAGKDHFIL